MAIDHRRRRIASGIVLFGVGALGFRALAQPNEQVVKVVAKRYEFMPAEVRLKRGVPAVLELTSADVPMGFSAPDFRVRANILPGMVARVRIVPDKAGTFDFVCDVFCGSGHEDMSGTIVVT